MTTVFDYSSVKEVERRLRIDGAIALELLAGIEFGEATARCLRDRIRRPEHRRKIEVLLAIRNTTKTRLEAMLAPEKCPAGVRETGLKLARLFADEIALLPWETTMRVFSGQIRGQLAHYVQLTESSERAGADATRFVLRRERAVLRIAEREASAS